MDFLSSFQSHPLKYDQIFTIWSNIFQKYQTVTNLKESLLENM
jgi:hypothetical protein